MIHGLGFLNIAVFSYCLGVAAAQGSPETVFVAKGQPKLVREDGKSWQAGDEFLECSGQGNFLFASRAIGAGDFQVLAKLALMKLGHTAASFAIDEASHFGFDGGEQRMFVQGPLFGGKTHYIEDSVGLIAEGEPFVFECVRDGSDVLFRIDGKEVYRISPGPKPLGSMALRPWRSTMRVFDFRIAGQTEALPPAPSQPRGYTIPTIDLAQEKERQVVVERIPG